MKFLAACGMLLACAFITTINASNLICYYDSASHIREGLGKLLPSDIEIAMQYCTHLIYGFAGIKPNSFQLYSLNEDLDVYKNQFAEVANMKRQYSHLKVLLSVGGDRDIEPEKDSNKYIEMLEGERVKQTAFINSAYALLRKYGFDGLDLAFQFPKNKARKVHSELGLAWKKFKKFFTGDFVVDSEAERHKEEFTGFVRDLRNAFRPDGLMLSLTVLPNVNSSWYFDIPTLSNNLDFINLAAFDFMTPERNPEEADYTASLYDPAEQNRLSHYNVNFQVQYWLQNKCPPSKLNVGIATYGRAWKLTSDSGTSGMPVIASTDGPAPAGLQSQMPGLLSWPEICRKLQDSSNSYLKGADAPLRRINDPTRRFGTYAFRPADNDGQHGMWVSYEDTDTIANKAGYVRSKNLGGIAIFDLSYDDFRGQCAGDKYPLLRAAKYHL